MPSALLLITQMEVAGGQRAMMQHARELVQRGWRVRCVTFYDKGSYAAFFEKTYGVKVEDLKAWKKGGPILPNALMILRGVFRLFRIMLTDRFDVFHAFTHYSNVIGVSLAYLAGIPVRVSCQAVTTDKLPRWFQWVDRLVANSRMTSCMVAVSKTTRDDSVKRVGIREDKILCIPNAPEVEPIEGSLPDIRQELGLEEKAVIGLVMARLHPLKGHAYLFEAFQMLSPEERRSLHILCAGDGQDRKRLEDWIKEKNLSSNLHLLGARLDVPRLLRDANFTILPSLSEGMPMCVLESLLAGKPVLSTSTDGAKEVVTPACGFLVPPADAKALADGLRKMLASDLQKMGEAGKERIAAHFSLQKQIDAFIELYGKFLPALSVTA